MKEYKILHDSGEVRKMEAQINLMAKEGWKAISIGGERNWVYVIMERELQE